MVRVVHDTPLPTRIDPRYTSHPARSPLRMPRRDSLPRSATGVRRRMVGEAPRVLLIVPPYTRLVLPAPPGTAYAELGLDTFEVMKRAGTPIGLVRIGTAARRAGYEVRIVDAPFEGWSQEQRLLRAEEGELWQYGLTPAQIRRIVEEFEPDVVGIQCNYTVQWGNARALADLVKAMDPGIVTLSGGAHSSGDWENAIADAPFDYIVVNEADRSFVALLDALTSLELPAFASPGIAYRRDGRRHANPRFDGAAGASYISLNPGRQSLEERKRRMPLPDFGLLDMARYDLPYHSSGARARAGGAWAQIFSSIGCSVRCDFCYIPMINGPWRALGADWFDEHLAEIKRHGVTEVLIEDDHLLHDPLYAMSIFEVLRRHQLPWVQEGGLSLFTLLLLHEGKALLSTLSEAERRGPRYQHVIRALEAGLDCAQLLDAMARSGCYSVYLAVESANAESLAGANKPRLNTIRRATAEVVSMFAERGIQVTGGFMLGFVNPPERPGDAPYIETLEQVDRTIEYAVELMGAGMAYANPFIVTPIPGSKVWRFQREYVVRNYDTGWSHERATLSTPRWSAEQIEARRLELLVRANGPDKVRKMVARGTWPVDTALPAQGSA